MNFASGFNRFVLTALPPKNFSSILQKFLLIISLSRTHKRGASRSSRVLGAGCDGRDHAVRRAAWMRTAKSCRPDAQVAGAKPADDDLLATETTKPSLSGVSTNISVNTIAQGMPVQRLTCSDDAHVLLAFVHEAMGVAETPGIPCALFFRRARLSQSSGAIASRECGVVAARLFDM
jgi:hypothetical protein